LASIGVLTLMLTVNTRMVALTMGDWLVLPAQHFHFTFKFVFDRLSVPFVILSFVLCGTTGAFASRYLHREPGFGRFFVLFALFLLGMIVTSLAGTIETLFAGWELVGLSSALLVAFFHERTAPVWNGLRVWTVYRIADAAFLVATVALHHLTGGAISSA
jgi:NAD(P)H-quinone oxidoreductase subunit 5